jgi:phosphoglycerate kinase
MENTRFHEEEKTNDKKFAKKLTHDADVFVFDAFGMAHRDQASTTGVAAFVSEVCFGLLMEEELKVFSLDNMPPPLKAVIGAAKIGTKMPILENLIEKVDVVLLGGAIVFTFLKALGYEIGTSLVDDEQIENAKKLYEQHKDKIVLPVDIVVSEEIEGNEIFTVAVDKIPANMKGLDVGDDTISLFKEQLEHAGTVFCNGPLGLFEVPPFDHATNEIAKYLADSHMITIVGGGDTEKAIIDAGVSEKFTHISTGGGASLKLVAGQPLVVVEKLS